MLFKSGMSWVVGSPHISYVSIGSFFMDIALI